MSPTSVPEGVPSRGAIVAESRPPTCLAADRTCARSVSTFWIILGGVDGMIEAPRERATRGAPEGCGDLHEHPTSSAGRPKGALFDPKSGVGIYGINAIILVMSQRDRLRAARRTRGLTQQELAALIGVPQSTIGRLETNRHEPSLRIALRLARALDTTVEHLFGDEDPALPVQEHIPPRAVVAPADVPDYVRTALKRYSSSRDSRRHDSHPQDA